MNKRLVAVLYVLLALIILIVGYVLITGYVNNNNVSRYRTHPPITKECNINKDCGENYKCSSGQCLVVSCPNGTIISGDSRTCCKPDSECIKDTDCPNVREFECFYCKCAGKQEYS